MNVFSLADHFRVRFRLPRNIPVVTPFEDACATAFAPKKETPKED